MRTSTNRAVVAALATTLLLAACGSGGSSDGETTAGEGPGTGGELETVTVRHSWLPDDLVMPILAAKHLGYYEEEGIVVVDQVGNGGATAAQLVATGQVMIGTGEAANVVNARQNGLDVVNIATQLQDQPNTLVTMKSSGIEEWSDLVGKKIGTTTTSSGHVGLLASLAKQGISEDQVEFVNFPAGAALTTLPSGEIDAAGTFYGNIAGVEFRDDLNVLTYSSAGYKAPSTGYFVTSDTLENKKDLLVRWLRATLKGLRYTIDHPDEVAEFLPTEYANVDAAATAEKWKLNAQFVDTPAVAEHGLGYQDPQGWEDLKEALVGAGSVTEDLDVTAAYSDAILDEIPVEDRS